MHHNLFCDFSFSWKTTACLQDYTGSRLSRKLVSFLGEVSCELEFNWLAEGKQGPGLYSSSSICPQPPIPKSFLILSPSRAEWRSDTESRIQQILSGKQMNEWLGRWVRSVSDGHEHPLERPMAWEKTKEGFYIIKGIPGEGGYSQGHHSLNTSMSPF